MNICVITFAPEYNGSMYLYHNAELGANNFELCIKRYVNKIKDQNINVDYKKVHGSQCNSKTICDHLSSIDPKYDKIIVYYSGHGDHRAGKEFWQTSSGNVDQVRIAELLNKIKPPAIIFSDCCSAEHNVNEKVINHPYVSFGATQDYQDAMMMYGGGLFTSTLIEILDSLDESNLGITLFDIFNLLMMKKVTVQTFSFKFSSQELAHSRLI